MLISFTLCNPKFGSFPFKYLLQHFCNTVVSVVERSLNRVCTPLGCLHARGTTFNKAGDHTVLSNLCGERQGTFSVGIDKIQALINKSTTAILFCSAANVIGISPVIEFWRGTGGTELRWLRLDWGCRFQRCKACMLSALGL